MLKKWKVLKIKKQGKKGNIKQVKYLNNNESDIKSSDNNNCNNNL